MSPACRSVVWTSVPTTLRLWVAEPALLMSNLPSVGAEMLAGVIANSVKPTCTAPAGTPVSFESACAATTNAKNASIKASSPNTTPAVPTTSRSLRLNKGIAVLSLGVVLDCDQTSAGSRSGV